MKGKVHTEERGTGNVGDSARPEWKIIPVFKDETDDFAKTECDNSEIIAAQAEHRKTEKDSEKCPQGAADGKQNPET